MLMPALTALTAKASEKNVIMDPTLLREVVLRKNTHNGISYELVNKTACRCQRRALKWIYHISPKEVGRMPSRS